MRNQLAQILKYLLFCSKYVLLSTAFWDKISCIKYFGPYFFEKQGSNLKIMTFLSQIQKGLPLQPLFRTLFMFQLIPFNLMGGGLLKLFHTKFHPFDAFVSNQVFIDLLYLFPKHLLHHFVGRIFNTCLFKSI